ncbi:MAG: hypothetical protein V1844_14250 [Pseudomonadota bacterium]
MEKTFSEIHKNHLMVSSMRIVCSVSLISLAVLVLSGCASTHFKVTGQVPHQPLCQPVGEQASALVFWGTNWRLDQKEVPLREAAAQRGIEHFFSTSECFAKVRVIHKVGDRESIELQPAEVPGLAATYASAPVHVLFITVRELGPIVKLFSSLALVEGGTDVVLEIRAFSPSTGQTTADFTAHWQNGGPWVIKGVSTLEQDITSALQEALKPSKVPK